MLLFESLGLHHTSPARLIRLEHVMPMHFVRLLLQLLLRAVLRELLSVYRAECTSTAIESRSLKLNQN